MNRKRTTKMRVMFSESTSSLLPRLPSILVMGLAIINSYQALRVDYTVRNPPAVKLNKNGKSSMPGTELDLRYDSVKAGDRANCCEKIHKIHRSQIASIRSFRFQ
jgi:hypothetical protein